MSLNLEQKVSALPLTIGFLNVYSDARVDQEFGTENGEQEGRLGVDVDQEGGSDFLPGRAVPRQDAVESPGQCPVREVPAIESFSGARGHLQGQGHGHRRLPLGMQLAL